MSSTMFTLPTSYYNHFIPHHFSMFWCLAQAQCQRYKVQYLMGFKIPPHTHTHILSRSVQIISNSECAINLLCSLISSLQRYCCAKLMHVFPVVLHHSFRQTELECLLELACPFYLWLVPEVYGPIFIYLLQIINTITTIAIVIF